MIFEHSPVVKMFCQLMTILMIFSVTNSVKTDEELLSIIKKNFQKDNKPLIDTLNKRQRENTVNNFKRRGFEDLTETNGKQFIDNLVNQLTTDQKIGIIGLYKDSSKRILKEDLKQLPCIWQFLILKQTYSLNMAKDWIEVVGSQNPDLSLLYDLGQRMNLIGADTDDKFMMSNLVPPPFEQHFKFLGSYSQTEFINFLTMDKILKIPKKESESAVEKLKNVWFQVKPGQQEAWYTLFKNSIKNFSNWNHIDNIERYGYLLGGAPIGDIELLHESAAFRNRSSSWLKVIQETEINPLRKQVIWNSLNEDDKILSFPYLAAKLHLTQIQKYHGEHEWSPKSDREEIERFAFMDGSDVPFENILMFSKFHNKDIFDMRKFVVGLTIPEIKNFMDDDWDVENIVSDHFSFGQTMVLYKKLSESNFGNIPVNAPIQLLHVMPSDEIENIYDYNLVIRKYDFIKASRLMLQSQMSALHKRLRLHLWERDTLEMILDNHPQCLEAGSPAEFRQHINLILEALPQVEITYYDGGQEMARKLRNLPREFQTSWLEVAFQLEENRDDQYWNTSRLLESRENMRTAIVILGLNCQQIERIRPSDTMSVLTAYQYLTEIHEMETGIPAHIPRHVRKCWAKKIRTYLKMKSMLVEEDVSREVDLLSMLNTAEIKTIGGEILFTWGVDILMRISHEKVRNEVLEAVGALPPCHLINNVANFTEVKSLANIKVSNSINLDDLSRLGNFFPYIDSINDHMDITEFKLFVQSLSDHQRAICVNKEMRESLRHLILVSFDLPENLSALDLAQLGDLLIVLNEDDLSKINPTNLLRANSELVKSTSYHRPVPEFLKEAKPIPFHEACRRWLGKNESSDFEESWRRLSDFYTLASYLALETIEEGGISHRRKRQTPNDSQLLTSIFNLLIEWHMASKLSKTQEQKCGQILMDGEKALARESLKTLKMDNYLYMLNDKNEATQEILREIIVMQKQDSSMNQQKKYKLDEIIRQIKHKVVQELVVFLGLNENDLDITGDELKHAMSLNSPLIEESYNFYKIKHSPSSTVVEQKARSFIPNANVNRGKEKNNETNYYQLFQDITQSLTTWYQDGYLSEDQKQNWAKIQHYGQSALARETLKVLDLLDENTGATAEEVSKIVKVMKHSGSISEQDNMKINEITEQIMLKMVQEMIKYLDLTENDLNTKRHISFKFITSLDTPRIEESYQFYKHKSVSSSPEIFHYTLFHDISKLRYQDGFLTEDQKQHWDTIFNDGNSALVRETLKVFNLLDENTDATWEDVGKIINMKKDDGSLSKEEELKINEITEQILLKMVQEMVKEFGLTKNDLHMKTDEFKYITLLDTLLVEESYKFYKNKSVSPPVKIKPRSYQKTNDNNYYKLFNTISLLLNKRHQAGNLTEDQFLVWVHILTDGQSALARENMKVLNLLDESIDTSIDLEEVSKIIAKKRRDGSLTDQEQEELKEIASQIILKMLQEIIKNLDLSEKDLDMEAVQLRYIMSLDTSRVKESYDIYKEKSDASFLVHNSVEMEETTTKKPPTKSSSQTNGNNYYKLFKTVSLLLNKLYQAGNLTENQYLKWVAIVSDVQKALARKTLQVLNINKNIKIEDVIELITEKKRAGSLTKKKQQEIIEMAKPIILKMVQNIIKDLGLSENELDLTPDQFNYIMTFNTNFITASSSTESTPGPGSESSTPATSAPNYISELKYYRELSELISNKALLLVQEWYTAGNITENQKRKSFQIIQDCNLAYIRESFKLFNILDYNIETINEEIIKTLGTRKSKMTFEETKKIEDLGTEALLKLVQEITKLLNLNEKDLGVSFDEFHTIMDLATPNIKDSYDYYTKPEASFAAVNLPQKRYPLLKDVSDIKCNVLRIAGKGTFGFSDSIIRRMDVNEVEACLETIGSLLFDKITAQSIWFEVKKKAFPSDRKITSDEMILLGSLLPTIAQFNLEMLDLSRSALEGISLLGRYLFEGCYGLDCDFSEVPAKVIQEYVKVNKIDNFTSVELESFGQLLCGLSEEDWDSKVTDAVFKDVHFIFNRIDCDINNPKIRASVEKKVLEANKSPEYWTPSDVSHLGWLIGSLSPQSLIKIQPESMEGVSGVALRMWTPPHWKLLSAEQIKHIGPHAMSLVDQDSFPITGGIIYFEKEKRSAIRSAASEGTDLMHWVDKIIDKMVDRDEFLGEEMKDLKIFGWRK